jgi:hypothetical protein
MKRLVILTIVLAALAVGLVHPFAPDVAADDIAGGSWPGRCRPCLSEPLPNDTLRDLLTQPLAGGQWPRKPVIEQPSKSKTLPGMEEPLAGIVTSPGRGRG